MKLPPSPWQLPVCVLPLPALRLTVPANGWASRILPHQLLLYLSPALAVNRLHIHLLNTLRNNRVDAPVFAPNALGSNRDKSSFWVSKSQIPLHLKTQTVSPRAFPWPPLPSSRRFQWNACVQSKLKGRRNKKLRVGRSPCLGGAVLVVGPELYGQLLVQNQLANRSSTCFYGLQYICATYTEAHVVQFLLARANPVIDRNQALLRKSATQTFEG